MRAGTVGQRRWVRWPQPVGPRSAGAAASGRRRRHRPPETAAIPVVTGPGTGPEPGPSSADSTGVGTTEAPATAFPAWAVHPEATATARRLGLDQPGDGMVEPSVEPVTAMPAAPTASATDADHGTTALKVLPRQTGARRADALGRDELGIRLIGGAGACRPLTADGDGPDPGGPGRGDER